MEEYGQAYMRPPPITVQSEEEYEVESILQARRKGPNDSLEYKVHWKGYPSADDSWVTHDDLHSPELLKEFYDQGGKILQDKRRCTRLRKTIASLSCLPPTMSTPSSLRSSIMERQPPMMPSFKSKGAPYTLLTLHKPSPSSKIQWWLSQKRKKKPSEEPSSNRPSKPLDETPAPETVRLTSSTHHPDPYKDSCSLMDTLLNRVSSTEWYSSTRTFFLSTPPLPQLQLLIPNLSSSPIPTSSYYHGLAHRIQFILDHHCLRTKKMKKIVGNTDHNPPYQKRDHNQELFQAKNGLEISKGWNLWSTTAYPGWQVGKSSPLSSAMTSLRTI